MSKNASWIDLRTVDLGANSIGDEGAAALGQNKSWINLQALGLEGNNIAAKEVIGLSSEHELG